jgi:hypothetical protein
LYKHCINLHAVLVPFPHFALVEKSSKTDQTVYEQYINRDLHIIDTLNNAAKYVSVYTTPIQ